MNTWRGGIKAADRADVSARKFAIPKADNAPLSVHRVEELAVRLRLAQLVEQELDGVDRPHRVEDAAQHVHLLERVLLDQELLLAGAGAGDVDRREDALVRDLAVENDLRVAGALELLEDDLVHA